jgi:DNA-binding PucR family transcriptional regulator
LALTDRHERTIGYRLAKIEELLGRPLAARREEIGVALRLRATLTP